MKKILSLLAICVMAVTSAFADEATLQDLIAQAIAAGKSSIDLTNGQTYQLTDVADLGYTAFKINGNGATIKQSGNACIKVRKSFVIDNVVLDAKGANVAPIRLASKDDMFKADGVTPADDNAAALYSYDTATETFKFDEGKPYKTCEQKVFVADSVSIINSTLKDLRNGIIWGNDAPWALLKLNIDNCQISIYGETSVPVINFYGGANSIQSININNSTLVSTSINSSFYFLRYTNSTKACPYRVWGYNSQDTWTMTHNTFVNTSALKNFANNYPNLGNYSDATKGEEGKPQVVISWKKNVFANTYRLYKVGTDNTFDFTPAYNVICGGTYPVEDLDKEKIATEVSDLGVYYNSDADKNFTLKEGTYAYIHRFGDLRWYSNNTAIFDNYYRETANGKYGTICLPHLFKAAEGAELYVIDSIKDGNIKLAKVDYAEAGYPYIYLATDAKQHFAIIEDWDRETIADNGMERNNFYGTYVTYYAQNYEFVFDETENQFVKVTSGSKKVAGYTGYIYFDKGAELTLDQKTLNAKALTINFDGGTTTGINEVQGSMSNVQSSEGKYIKDGRIIIIRAGKQYTTAGQQIK